MEWMEPDSDDAEFTWMARGLRPVVAVYVSGVFAGFMALAHFVVHSPEGVKALALAAVGSLASLIPSMLARVEFRLTKTGLERRRLSPKEPREFEEVFLWGDLNHMAPTGSGYKFYKRGRPSNRWRRFLKLSISGRESGEFQVDPEDRERVEAIISRQGIPTSKPRKTETVKSGTMT